MEAKALLCRYADVDATSQRALASLERQCSNIVASQCHRFCVAAQQSKQTTTMQRSKLLPRSTDRVAERATMLHDLIARRTTTTTTRTHRHTRAGTVPLVDFPPFIAHTPQNPCTFVFLRTITNHTNTLSATALFPTENKCLFL